MAHPDVPLGMLGKQTCVNEALRQGLIRARGEVYIGHVWGQSIKLYTHSQLDHFKTRLYLQLIQEYFRPILYIF